MDLGRVVDRGFSGGDGRVGRDVWGEVRSIQNKKKNLARVQVSR